MGGTASQAAVAPSGPTAIDADPLPAIIDVEASGFGAGSYPIEVGVILPDGSASCFLILPAPDWTHWDPSAEAVHRITRPILERHGRPIPEVAAELNRILTNRTIYSDAWGHDRSWIARLFDEAGMPQRFRLEALRGLMTEAQMACWEQARTAVQAGLGLVRHRASADAMIIQKTFAESRARSMSRG